MNLHIVILAAGKGTRMRSRLPKVLHQLGGKPLLEHVLQTATQLQPQKIHVVHGEDNGDLIREYLKQYDINWIKQTAQLGTGHAVMQALPAIEQEAQVLVLYGDVPLITAATLKQLIATMQVEGLSLLTAEFADPAGLGRIVRDDLGGIRAIVEHKDATSREREIKEINSGILVTNAKILHHYLPRVQPHNAQGEYYLTDIIAMLYAAGAPLSYLLAKDQAEVLGVNDQQQRAVLERLYQTKIAEKLMMQGLTLMDPTRFDVRGDLLIGTDVTIDVNTVVEGAVVIGDNTTVGSNNWLKDTRIGKNVTIKANCVIDGAVIADDCVVGPFARIRPGTYLDQGVHIGNFVEVKNAQIGKNSKASHLSYLGDAVIGCGVNVGAGTITCNYDGVNKHKTVIEDLVFVGSNTCLIAPITVGKNAMIGAGSVITMDVPVDKLAVARARQVILENWLREKTGK